MKITFAINYRADEGQALKLVGRATVGQSRSEDYTCLLSLNATDFWIGELDVQDETNLFEYHYCLVAQDDNDVILRQEVQNFTHRLYPNPTTKALYSQDSWLDKPKYSYLYSSAFTDVLYPTKAKAQKPKPQQKRNSDQQSLHLDVFAPFFHKDYQLYLLGESPLMGAWQKENALPFDYMGGGRWSLSIEISRSILQAKPYQNFKLVLMDKAREDIVWEEGENRTLNFAGKEAYDSLAFSALFFRLPQDLAEHNRLAGVVLPLFALRTMRDSGVGDFGSLKLALAWAKEAKMSVFQLLPINDTIFYRDWRDSYPYNAISVKALHPIYADLKALAPIKDKTLKKTFNERAKELRALESLDYPKVMAYQEAYLRQHFVEQREAIASNNAFKVFSLEQEAWLRPYTYFSVLRDREEFQGKMPKDWGRYAHYQEELFDEAFQEQYAEDLQFYAYVQFVLDQQLREARDFADECGIILKGDIPIGVAPHSVDAWAEPHLFNMTMSAGAPPDDFAEEGQNWGFPTYNWERMQEDNFAWWRSRLTCMQTYFSAYRIDHILGFFRIWGVPRSEASALMGQFMPSLPFPQDFWEEAFPNKAFEVLTQEALVPDVQQAGYYHPRIAFDKSEVYQTWTEEEQRRWQEIKQDYFYERHNHLWQETAYKRLSALIESSRMLACAEDLGMIPQTVPEVLKNLEVLSLDLERMPKTLSSSPWAKLKELPYLSLCTTSTHDMPSLRYWWQLLSQEDKQSYVQNVLNEDVAIIKNEALLFEQIIRCHLQAPSMAVVLPLMDWLSMTKLNKQKAEEEQINHPDNPNQQWSYRMPFALDTKAKAFLGWQKQIAMMIEQAGRY